MLETSSLDDPEHLLLYLRCLKSQHRQIPQNLFKILPKTTLERLRRQWLILSRETKEQAAQRRTEKAWKYFEKLTESNSKTEVLERMRQFWVPMEIQNQNSHKE